MNSTTLKKHKALDEEVKSIGDIYQENLITIKDRSKDEKVDYTKDDGETVNVSENLIWQELYYHPKGQDSAAGVFLRGKYPELFELQDQYEVKKQELQEFEAKEFGFRGNEMTLADLLSIIDGMIEFKLKNK